MAAVGEGKEEAGWVRRWRCSLRVLLLSFSFSYLSNRIILARLRFSLAQKIRHAQTYHQDSDVSSRAAVISTRCVMTSSLVFAPAVGRKTTGSTTTAHRRCEELDENILCSPGSFIR
jgi:hypothetical protein